MIAIKFKFFSPIRDFYPDLFKNISISYPITDQSLQNLWAQMVDPDFFFMKYSCVNNLDLSDIETADINSKIMSNLDILGNWHINLGNNLAI